MSDTKVQEDRRLLADVHRWARQNGWAWNEAWGWVNARYASEATIAVEWENGQITVSRATNGVFRPTRYDVDSVRQAVGVLVSLEILPVEFSTAYQAGREFGYATGYGDGRDDTIAAEGGAS